MLNSPGAPRNVLAAALWSSILHLSLAIIIQFENYLTYLATDWGDLAWWLASLPFIQLENVVFAGVLIVLAVVMVSNTLLRWAYFLFSIGCNAYLAVDQLAYKIFFDHIPYVLIEADYTFTGMLSQLLSQADPWLLFNSACVVGSAWLLYWVVICNQTYGIERLAERSKSLFSRPIAQVFTVAMLFFSVIVITNGAHQHLNQHALVKLVYPMDSQYRAIDSAGNIYYPRFGKELRRYNQSLKNFQEVVKKIPQPSVVVITVKFKHGHHARDAIMTVPAIQELLANGAYFPEVYNSWPSSPPEYNSSADWLMVSGARAINSGTRQPSLKAYQNTRLARALKQQKYVSAFLAQTQLAPADIECFTPAALPIKQALKQLRDTAAPHQPFFLTLTTSLSLDTAPCSTQDAMPITFHQRSLLDQDLQALFQYLRTTRRLEDTVFVIYGEVSQQSDQKNAASLADERTKGFAIVSSSRYDGKSILADGVRDLTNAHAMLASLVGISDNQGVSLLDTEAPARITYFMDGQATGRWGLRDGNWKFSVSTLGGQAALYNLANDAQETINLARYYPQRVKLYEQLCAAWYANLYTDLPEIKHHFVYVKGRLQRQFESGLPGAKKIIFGYYDGLVNASKFLPRDVFNPYDPIALSVNWVAYPSQKQFEFKWSSPTGQSYSYPFVVDPWWSHSWTTPGFGLPMEAGLWTVTLIHEGQAVMAKDFVVDPKQVQKHLSNTQAIIRQAEIGFYNTSSPSAFVANNKLSAKQIPIFWTRWEPQGEVRFIIYKWQSPKGTLHEKEYAVRGDWKETWVDYEGPVPLERGQWQVSIWQNGKMLTESAFEVVN